MDNNKTRVSVFVAGQRFNILTDKKEKYVLDIASEIDARINSLVVSQGMSRERAAVLTALDYADDSELDKENIAAVKEQIKDYLHEVERLRDNNAKLVGDYSMLKSEYERLIEEKQSAENAQKTLADSQSQIAALQEQLIEEKQDSENAQKALTDCQAQIAALQEQLAQAQAELENLRQQQNTAQAPAPEVIPLPQEPPVKEEKPITAEDDLFFDMEETHEQIKPEKKKKNRHDHSHVNPYQQKAKEKAQKGYQQQRQYSFFELDEE